MLAFGPIPSRRLGASLGINHIPPKHCSYACVYCQAGRTTNLEIARRAFFPLELVLRDVEQKINETIRAGYSIDYLSLVPDGEPTLDLHLGKLIDGLKPFGYPIAVISNATLIDRADVREDLLHADWVSMKVDTVIDPDWRRINRPFGRLTLLPILEGIMEFRDQFNGHLVTETMLVDGINDHVRGIRQLTDYLWRLQPETAYLSLPTRPPSERWVTTPSAVALKEALTIFGDRLPFMTFLFQTDTSDFHSTGNLEEDILSITAVHPLNEKALENMVAEAEGDWAVVDELLASGKLNLVEYHQQRFYLRSEPLSNYPEGNSQEQ